MLGAAAFLAALTVPIVAAEAAPPTPPFNALTVDGSGSNPVLTGGHSLSYSGASVTLASSDGGVTVASGTTSVVLVPPTGADLALGSALPTLTAPDATHYGLVVSVAGTACAAPGAGTVTISQLTVDTGNVTALAATYSTTCGSGSDTVSGEIRFNSTVGYVGATQDVSSLSFGSVDTGFNSATKTVTFTSVGSNPIVFGTAAFAGTDPDSFVITADTCSGKSIGGTSTCAVTVAANAKASGSNSAKLTISDNTKLGGRTVSLSATASIGSRGTYKAVPPARVADTRPAGPLHGLVGPNKSLTVPIAGKVNVPPTGASAVVINVTVADTKVGGFVTVYPAGAPVPTASNLNYTAGSTRANSVTVGLGTGGAISIFNSGQSDVIVDVTGYFIGSDALATGGQYYPQDPYRTLDSRAPHYGPMAYGDGYFALYGFGDPSIDQHITALAVNITAVGPAAGGWFTAWNGQGNPPSSSTVNFAKGATTPNMAIIPTSPCHVVIADANCDDPSDPDYDFPTIAVVNFAHGNANIIVDVIGFFDDNGSLADQNFEGTRFHPLTPTRIVDTRTKLGATPLTANKSQVISVPKPVADDLTYALAMNVTAVSPSSSTYLSFWPANGDPLPVANQPSTLNPVAHQTVANATIMTMGDQVNAFYAWNASGTTGFLADVAGFYEIDPATFPGAVTLNKAMLGQLAPAAVATGRSVKGDFSFAK